MATGERDARQGTVQAGTPSGNDDAIDRAIRALQADAGPKAFEPIYRHYYRPLHRFFSRRTVLREEADDLTQETLLRALRKIGLYQFQSSFAAWLQQIGENVWKNAVRKRRAVRRGGGVVESLSRAVDSGEIEPTRTVLSEAAPTPEQAALATERSRVIGEALRKLPPGMRRCAELRLGHDLKYQEIADVTATGLNNVRSQLFEARKRLRPILGRYFSDADF